MFIKRNRQKRCENGLNDETGATILEVALVMPIFFFLIFATIEICLTVFYSFIIESAMQDAVRYSKLSLQTDNDIGKVKDLMHQRSFGLLDADKVFITSDVGLDVHAKWSTTPHEQCSACQNGLCRSKADTGNDFATSGQMQADEIAYITQFELYEIADISLPPPTRQCPCPSGWNLDDTNGNGQCDMGPPPLALGGPGDVRLYVAFYQYEPITPYVQDLLGFNYVISSGVLVRNEP